MHQGGWTLNEKRTAQRATLYYVNRIRNACGNSELKQLPAGIMQRSSDCAIARSLVEIDNSVNVFQTNITTMDREFAKIIAREFGYDPEVIRLNNSDGIKKFEVPLPRTMAMFVDYFDQGNYPKLVEAQL